MRLFIDTNIIIEYIERRNQYEAARTILESLHNGVHEGLVSQGSIYTLAYLTERSLKANGIHRPELTERVRNIMAAILQLVEPIGISRAEMLSAIANHDFCDLEDSMQYQCASQNRCGTLITININDYKDADQSRMEILTPSAFVDKYMNVEPLKPQMPMG